MNNTFMQPAWKLPWDAVASIVEARLLKHLHTPIPCKAVREDEHYWSIQRLEGIFTREDITHLLQAESAPLATVHSELSMEGDSSRALSTELSSLLLQHELCANWEFEYLTSEALWLLGCQKCSKDTDGAQSLYFHLPDLDIPLSDLKSREELLTFLRDRGANYVSLMEFSDVYLERYGNCLYWHYPISDGTHLGTYLVLVQEGVLSLPYDDENDVPCGRFYLEDAALFRTTEEMECFIDDWRHFDADLTQALYAMKDLLQQQEVQRRDDSAKEH